VACSDVLTESVTSAADRKGTAGGPERRHCRSGPRGRDDWCACRLGKPLQGGSICRVQHRRLSLWCFSPWASFLVLRGLPVLRGCSVRSWEDRKPQDNLTARFRAWMRVAHGSGI